MSRLLVTGATGYIGRVVMGLLAGHAFEVHGVSRHPHPQPAYAAMHQVDLLNEAAVTHLIERLQPTHLLHLAWDLSGNFYTSPANRAWLDASKHLLRTFQTHGGARALIAGTCVEYDLRFGYCVEDQTPCAPATLYGQSKHALHQYAQELARRSPLKVAWLRLFSSYGPGEAPGRLVPSALRALHTDTPLEVSDGQQVRDYLHVYDVATACLAVLDSEVTGPINIASGVPVQVADLLHELTEHLGGQELFQWGARPRGADDPPFIVGSNKRLLDQTDWRPLFSLPAGIQHTLHWYRNRRTAT